MKETIKLNMTDYQIRKRYGKTALTESEKIARLYALAGKLNVKIGESDGHTKRNSQG